MFFLIALLWRSLDLTV